MTDIMPGTEDGYLDVSVIAEGALDESRIFGITGAALPTEPLTSLEEFVQDIEDQAARNPDVEIEVYVLEHQHPLDYDDDGEDTCAQYVTDHHPDYAWNIKEEA